MSDTLRHLTLRLASTMPKGSKERKALLAALKLEGTAVEVEAGDLKLAIDRQRGTCTLTGTGTTTDVARALTRYFLRHLAGVGTRSVLKPVGKVKGFSFHWSNAQAAWDVIVATPDMLSMVDGADFILFCPLTTLSPLGRPWSLTEMKYVAKALGNHPGYASSMEGGQRWASKTAFGGVRVSVRELPETVQRALKGLKYGRRDIEVEAGSLFSFQDFGGDGYRGFTAVVNMETGQSKVTYGSWGGPNPYTKGNLVDSDDRDHPIPVNAAIIQGREGGGRPVYATLKVHPDNMATLIPAKINLTPQEEWAISILDGIKPAYRAEYFERHDLGLYKGDNPLIKGLAEKGLVKVTGSGIQITTAGKNARNPSLRP